MMKLPTNNATPGEDQQEDVEKLQALRQRRGQIVGLFLLGLDVVAGAEGLCDPVLQLVVADAARGTHAGRGESPWLREKPLSGIRVESGQ